MKNNQGYDIPAGTAVAQLRQCCGCVFPKGHADSLRARLERGQAPRGGEINVHVQLPAMTADDVRALFAKYPDLVKAIKDAQGRRRP